MVKILDRVWQQTATTGTGTLTLGAALPGFLTAAEAGGVDADEVEFVIRDGDDFELSRGVLGSSATTLTRATVIRSKIGGTVGTSKINLSGVAEVFVVASAVSLVPPGSTNDRILAWVSGAYSWVQAATAMIADGAVTFAKMASGAVATFAEFNAATASKLLSTASVWADSPALTDGATIAVNFNNGFDFGGASNAVLLLGGNRTLSAPTNARNSKKGILWFGATGATRTLTLDAAWNLATGVEAGPYSITTSQELGVAYVTRGTTVIVTAIVRRG